MPSLPETTKKCIELHKSHHKRAADDAKIQTEAFDILMSRESTSYIAPDSKNCNSLPSVVIPYQSGEEQYTIVSSTN